MMYIVVLLAGLDTAFAAKLDDAEVATSEALKDEIVSVRKRIEALDLRNAELKAMIEQKAQYQAALLNGLDHHEVPAGFAETTAIGPVWDSLYRRATNAAAPLAAATSYIAEIRRARQARAAVAGLMAKVKLGGVIYHSGTAPGVDELVLGEVSASKKIGKEQAIVYFTIENGPGYNGNSGYNEPGYPIGNAPDFSFKIDTRTNFAVFNKAVENESIRFEEITDDDRKPNFPTEKDGYDRPTLDNQETYGIFDSALRAFISTPQNTMWPLGRATRMAGMDLDDELIAKNAERIKKGYVGCTGGFTDGEHVDIDVTPGFGFPCKATGSYAASIRNYYQMVKADIVIASSTIVSQGKNQDYQHPMGRHGEVSSGTGLALRYFLESKAQRPNITGTPIPRMLYFYNDNIWSVFKPHYVKLQKKENEEELSPKLYSTPVDAFPKSAWFGGAKGQRGTENDADHEEGPLNGYGNMQTGKWHVHDGATDKDGSSMATHFTPLEKPGWAGVVENIRDNVPMERLELDVLNVAVIGAKTCTIPEDIKSLMHAIRGLVPS